MTQTPSDLIRRFTATIVLLESLALAYLAFVFWNIADLFIPEPRFFATTAERAASAAPFVFFAVVFLTGAIALWVREPSSEAPRLMRHAAILGAMIGNSLESVDIVSNWEYSQILPAAGSILVCLGVATVCVRVEAGLVLDARRALVSLWRDGYW